MFGIRSMDWPLLLFRVFELERIFRLIPLALRLLAGYIGDCFANLVHGTIQSENYTFWHLFLTKNSASTVKRLHGSNWSRCFQLFIFLLIAYWMHQTTGCHKCGIDENSTEWYSLIESFLTRFALLCASRLASKRKSLRLLLCLATK